MPVLIDEPDLLLELTPEGIFYARLARSERASDEVLNAIQPHLEANAPVRYLVDVTEVKELTLAERWRLAERMKENRPLIMRTAVLGVHPMLRFPVQVILRVSGRDNVRLFATREDAQRWLLSDP